MRMTACQYRKIDPLDGSWHPLSNDNGVNGDRLSIDLHGGGGLRKFIDDGGSPLFYDNSVFVSCDGWID